MTNEKSADDTTQSADDDYEIEMGGVAASDSASSSVLKPPDTTMPLFLNKGGSTPRTVVVVLDEYDEDTLGAVDCLARWTSAHRHTAHIHIHAHVHRDHNFIISHALRVLSWATRTAMPLPRSERTEKSRTMLAELKSSMTDDGYDNIHVDLDVSDRSGAQALAGHLDGIRRTTTTTPSLRRLVILNERSDRHSLTGMFLRSESDLMLRTLQRSDTAVAIVRSTDATRRCPLSSTLSWNYLLCINACGGTTLDRSSRAALDTLSTLLLSPSRDHVCVLCSVDLPDAATALYSDEESWAAETKSRRVKAKKMGEAVGRALRKRHPELPESAVSVVVRNESFHTAAKSLLDNYEFHAVVLGVDAEEQRASSGVVASGGGLLSQVSVAVLGTNAEYFIRHSVVPVVVAAFA